MNCFASWAKPVVEALVISDESIDSSWAMKDVMAAAPVGAAVEVNVGDIRHCMGRIACSQEVCLQCFLPAVSTREIHSCMGQNEDEFPETFDH